MKSLINKIKKNDSDSNSDWLQSPKNLKVGLTRINQKHKSKTKLKSNFVFKNNNKLDKGVKKICVGIT